jgi:hypothetical protein
MLPYVTVVRELRQSIKGRKFVAAITDSSMKVGRDWNGLYSRFASNSSRL